MLRGLLLYYLIFNGLLFCKGQELVVYSDNDSTIAIENHLSFFVEGEEELSVYQVKDLNKGYWKKLVDTDEHRFSQSENLWVKLEVESDVVLRDYVFKLHDVKIAEAWLIEDNGISSYQKGGEFVEASSKEILARRKDFVISLRDIHSENFTLFVKLKNIEKSQVSLNWQLTPYEEWMSLYFFCSLKEIIFQSVLGVLMIISLLLFILILDKNYLYYSIYLGSVSIYFLWEFGITGNYIFGNYPNFNFFLKVFQNFVPIAYFLFVKHYVKYSSLDSWFFKSVLLIIGLNTGFVFVETVSLHWTMDRGLVFSNLANGLASFSMIYFSISFLRIKYGNVKQKQVLNAGIISILASYILAFLRIILESKTLS
ncbi:MAG: hypothetical protein CMO01_14665 [Thalassobius sp.]|nr:hypothetical protein [Thalassovita sp.]